MQATFLLFLLMILTPVRSLIDFNALMNDQKLAFPLGLSTDEMELLGLMSNDLILSKSLSYDVAMLKKIQIYMARVCRFVIRHLIPGIIVDDTTCADSHGIVPVAARVAFTAAVSQ